MHWKSSLSMNLICVIGSRLNFNSNSRLLMHSNKMARALLTLWQHWSTVLCRKAKEDNKKKIMEDVGVTKLTQELVELSSKFWAVILVSLILMVQRSTQHH